jgi:hypothetical protein
LLQVEEVGEIVGGDRRAEEQHPEAFERERTRHHPTTERVRIVLGRCDHH